MKEEDPPKSLKADTPPATSVPVVRSANSATARTIVYPGEARQDFEALEAAHLGELAPRTRYERRLAEDLIAYEWEIYRFRRLRDAAVLGRYRDIAIGAMTTGSPQTLAGSFEYRNVHPDEDHVALAEDLISADSKVRALAETDLAKLVGYPVDELLALAAHGSAAACAHNERIADLELRRRQLRQEYTRLRERTREPIEDAVLLDAA